MNAALKRKIKASLQAINVVSVTALGDVVTCINSALSSAHASLGDSADYKLYAASVYEYVAKALASKADELKADVYNTSNVIALINDVQAGQTGSIEFDVLSLVLTKSKAPESLDSKALVNALRTKYGTKLTKEVVDELVALSTKEGAPRKTFKIVQL